MPRRREAPGRVSPRRLRRDDRKPQALMDIVVSAVRRLGAQMGVSVTDIERCAVAEGDLPARAGARSILRLGLNRAVETGRLQRMPGGLFCLPGTDEIVDHLCIAANEIAQEKLEAVEDLECDSSVEPMVDESLAHDTDADLENAAMKEDVLLTDIAFSRPLVLDDAEFVGEDPERICTSSKRRQQPSKKDRRNDQDRRKEQVSQDGRDERTDAEHGRAAAAALFKLSADVISIISQTAHARLYSYINEVTDRNNVNNNPDNGHRRPRNISSEADNIGSEVECGGSSARDVTSETLLVVTAAGSALSAISVAATKGSRQVIEVSGSGQEEDGAGCNDETREAIFRAFKTAAMDIVRAARAFGESLGGATAVEPSDQPSFGRACDDSPDGGDSFEVMSMGFGPHDYAAMFPPRREPDMEGFLRGLLQDVRELAQRVGNCIDG